MQQPPLVRALFVLLMLAGCDGAPEAGTSPPVFPDAGDLVDGGGSDPDAGDPGPDASIDSDAGTPAPPEPEAVIRRVTFHGDEFATPRALPSCASPLMRAIHDRALEYADRDSVPSGLFVTERNRAVPAPLISGPAIFSRMGDLIAEAHTEVVFQTYVWEAESEAAAHLLDGIRRLHDRLTDHPEQPPVRVRFLLDGATLGLGGLHPEDTMPALAAELESLDLDPDRLRWEIGAFERAALGNLHVKVLGIDGERAVVTGANVEIIHDAGEPWYDLGFEVAGEVGLSVLADFEDAWREGRRWTCGSERGAWEDCSERNGGVVYRVVETREEACLPMMVAMRVADSNPVSNRIDNTQDQAFLAAFESARERVRMQTPNLNDDAAKAAILDAVRRGVTVEIVLSYQFNDLTQRAPGQGGPNSPNVEELYAALEAEGVEDRCERLRVRWFSVDGERPVSGNGPLASHAKAMTVDGQVAIVGSANMDTQSWNNSRELNLVIDDAATVAAWDAAIFDPNVTGGIETAECR